jgi:glycosyltransferase involved in cell wall biosynthesis
VTGPAGEPAAAAAAAGPDIGRPRGVAVVIPAKDEAERIAATVAAARTIAAVDMVIVVDDGSRDDTARLAREAGADVVRHERNRGKAAAMTSGADYVQRHEVGMPTPRALLFVDADLGDSAAATAALVPPVLSGEADLTIAVLPPQESPGGGHGFVVGLATRGIVRATSWTPTQPLSGMRCLSRPAFEAARPLARGWGVEVGMTVDLLRAGMRVLEVPCELHHRVTGRDLRAQLHRGRQYRDVWLALARRRLDVGRRLQARRRRPAADGPG